MENEYKPIFGYENLYEINKLGRVRTLQKSYFDKCGRLRNRDSKHMTIRVDRRSGYLVTKLLKPNGTYGSQYIHRLVALTFIDNPRNCPEVNHKDGVKTNAHVDNLEWVTKSENRLHAIKLKHESLPVFHKIPVINLCNGDRFDSIKTAARSINTPYYKVKKMLSNEMFNPTCLRRAA